MNSRSEIKLVLAMVVFLVAGNQLQAGVDESTSEEAHRIDLRQAISIALQKSLVLKEANLDLEIARGQVREAWSNVLPTVTASASYSRSIIPQSIFLPAAFLDTTDSNGFSSGETIPIQIGADNVYAASLRVNQPLLDFRAFVGVGASARYRDLQLEVLRGTTQLVVTQVRQAYLNALLAHEQVRLTEESLERVRQTLAEATALNRSGLTSDYDVLRLVVQESNLDAELHRARIGEAAARRNLLVDLGMPPDQGIILEGNLSELDLHDLANNSAGNKILLEMVGFHSDATPRIEPVLRDALASRSDLRQNQLATSLERARLTAQWSEFFPTMSVFYNRSIAVQTMGDPDPWALGDAQQAELALAGISLEIPLFSGFGKTARLQQRRAALRQSQVRRRRLELLATSQVHTLLSDLEDSRYRAESQLKALGQARRGYEIATAEYRSGLGSQLQITDAEVALRQSEFNYSSTVYEYLLVRTQLDVATGAVPINLEDLELQ